MLRITLVRYALVGGVSLGCNVALFSLFYVFGVWYVYASTVANWGVYFLNFSLHKFWTFEDKGIYKTAWQLPAHLSLKLLWNALIAAPALVYALVEYSQISPVYGQFAAGLIIGAQNFLVCRYIIFSIIRKS